MPYIAPLRLHTIRPREKTLVGYQMYSASPYVSALWLASNLSNVLRSIEYGRPPHSFKLRTLQMTRDPKRGEEGSERDLIKNTYQSIMSSRDTNKTLESTQPKVIGKVIISRHFPQTEAQTNQPPYTFSQVAYTKTSISVFQYTLSQMHLCSPITVDETSSHTCFRVL